MQDAFGGGWSRGSHLSAQTLGSLHDLNLRFLDLAAARPPYLRDAKGRAAHWTLRVAPLSAAQRSAAAGCPYALFDLRLNDVRHWGARLEEAASCRVADESSGVAPIGAIDFARLALFYAWHIASGPASSARLLLGMSEDTAILLRRIRVNQLPPLVESESRHLGARFGDCVPFWNALTAAAARADPAALRRVQLYGLQIAAAAGFDES